MITCTVQLVQLDKVNEKHSKLKRLRLAVPIEQDGPLYISVLPLWQVVLYMFVYLRGSGRPFNNHTKLILPPNFPLTHVKLQVKYEAIQGNSVAQDLPPTGSEANTTIFVLFILDIDSHCPYLLSGETTFQLTSR